MNRVPPSKVIVILAAPLLLAGCGNHPPLPLATAAPTSSPATLRGTVHGGQQPVVGAVIQLYAVNTTATAGPSSPLLTGPPITTGDGGSFTISYRYTCPANTSTPVYLVATTGNPGLATGTNNGALALIAALGPCSSLGASTSINVNEITTVAAAWALGSLMTDYTHVSSTSLASLTAAFTLAANIANAASGTTPGTGLPTNTFIPAAKVTTLANILASCINSDGTGATGNVTACGQLFTAATYSGTMPADTIAAAINIAAHPTLNVPTLFTLGNAAPPFQPALPTAPTDWNLTFATVNWATPAAIPYGTALSTTQLNASSNVAGTFTYSPLAGSIPSGGSATLTSTFTPSDSADYPQIVTSVQLTVNKATPTLTWATPAAIPAGTAIGSTQLNASASIPGTFSYTPASGSVLSTAGTQTLQTTFTPTDTTDYATATTSVSMTVGHTYYVSGTGNNNNAGTSTATAYATLQKAAGKVVAGDFVYVMNGTYTSTAYDGFEIATAGTANAWITWQAYPGASPVIQAVSQNFSTVRFINTAAYISFSGFTVNGYNANITLANAQANQSNPNNNPQYNGNCIDVVGTAGTSPYPNHINILNNIAGNCAGGGISVKTGDYITISGNTIFNNSWYTAYGSSAISNLNDVDTNAADTTTPYKMIVTGNTIYGNQEFIPWIGYTPPTVTDGEGIIIDTNMNVAVGSTSLPAYTGHTLVANNVIYNNGSCGIEVLKSAYVDVVNNSTYGNTVNAAYSTTLPYYEPGRGEMSVQSTSTVPAKNINIVNNIFYSSAGQNPVYFINACTNCTLDYNIYNGGSIKLNGYIAQGAHDFVIDPVYSAPTAASLSAVSLQLQSTSPLLTSPATYVGTYQFGPSSTTIPTTDINGVTRPSATVTRGAYQH
jgi:hypothetical protein